MSEQSGLHVDVSIKLCAQRPVCGEGVIELLEGVRETGSLRQACARLCMAYSKAWRIVRETESKLGAQLLRSASGGSAGGRSELTDFASELTARFRKVEAELRRESERLSRKYLYTLLIETASDARDPSAQ